MQAMSLPQSIKSCPTMHETSSVNYEQRLKIYFKLSKSNESAYIVLKALAEAVKVEPSLVDTETFQSLFQSAGGDIQQLSLYEQLSATIWEIERTSLFMRDTTRISKIVGVWAKDFETQARQLTTNSQKISWLTQFIRKNTKSALEIKALIREVPDDLKEVFGNQFWRSSSNKEISSAKSLDTKASSQESLPQQFKMDMPCGTEMVELLETVFVPLIFASGKCDNYSRNVSYGTDQFALYQHFINRCIYYSLSQWLKPNQEAFITKVALQHVKGLTDPQEASCIVHSLLHKISTPVKFAMAADFAEVNQFFQTMAALDVLESLQKSKQFRDVVMTSLVANIPSAPLVPSHLSKSIRVEARSTTTLLLSNESQYTLLVLLITNSCPPIDLQLRHISNGQEKHYWEALKVKGSQSTSSDGSKTLSTASLSVMLSFTGLYTLEIDNRASWITPKTIVLQLMFGKGLEAKLKK